jgi:hypothetical protein
MNNRSIFLAMALLPVAVAVSAEQALPSTVADAVARTGNPYREVVAIFTNDVRAAKHLQVILAQEPADSVNARHARILLAHIEHPAVFADFTNEIQKWRETERSSNARGDRPGVLSGMLMQFIKRGPESRTIEVGVGWESLPVGSNRQSKVIMRQRKHEKVEKYTDAEVQVGIARNAAARQAVLEHFLKFLDEGDAYEQSEIVELVNRLWGRARSKRTEDLAIVDNVSDADALIESVFQDNLRPAYARMRAALCLADSKPSEVQAFMLNVVTNTPTDDRGCQREDMVNRALTHLESTTNVNILSVLKNQTNEPPWKRERIEKANHAIEGRLSPSSGNK